jgi:hypothetical protein
MSESGCAGQLKSSKGTATFHPMNVVPVFYICRSPQFLPWTLLSFPSPKADANICNAYQFLFIVRFLSQAQESRRAIELPARQGQKSHVPLNLVERHRGSKILIFCDVIVLLHEYSRVLQVPVICGETPHKDE